MADQAGRLARRSYATTVVAGLAGAALTAVAGSRTWAAGHASAAGMHVDASVSGSQAAPLVGALGLVALAAWGVVLVTRRRVRRAVAVVGLLACLGSLAAAVLGLRGAGDQVMTALLDQGAGRGPLISSTTGWGYVAVAASFLTAAAFAVAVRSAPSWPEMGSKYDAPTSRAETAERGAEQPAGQSPEHGADMWRALDQGHDPTS